LKYESYPDTVVSLTMLVPMKADIYGPGRMPAAVLSEGREEMRRVTMAIRYIFIINLRMCQDYETVRSFIV
jgi:hypothetical protein